MDCETNLFARTRSSIDTVQALVASAGLLASQLVVGIIALENPNYESKPWHQFLIYIGQVFFASQNNARQRTYGLEDTIFSPFSSTHSETRSYPMSTRQPSPGQLLASQSSQLQFSHARRHTMLPETLSSVTSSIRQVGQMALPGCSDFYKAVWD